MITEKAMLAAVHISIWTAVKHDRKVSRDVADQHGAHQGAGRYNTRGMRHETPTALRIQKARTSLILDHPFFGSLLFRLKGRECRSIQTMATDGVSLFYNPDFVETLNAATLAGTLAHEVMHPALHHHVRRSGRDPKRWNVACDFAINPLLVDAGLSLPDGVLIDNRFRGMSAEQIYNLLESESETEQDSGKEVGEDEPGGEESKDETSGGGDSKEPSAQETRTPFHIRTSEP